MGFRENPEILCWYVFVLSVYQLQSREEKKVEII